MRINFDFVKAKLKKTVKRNLRRALDSMYARMRRRFGHQHWWPGDGAFEIMVGAVLTQNTAWRNVEKAILNLKNAGVLEPRKMLSLEPGRLAALIKPAGY